MILVRPWSRQPPANANFRRLPSARFATHWPRGIATAELISGDVLTSSGSPTLEPCVGGIGLRTVNASSQYVYRSASALGSTLAGETPYTIASAFVASNTSTRGSLVSLGSTASDIPYLWLEVNATAGRASFNTRPDSGGGEILTTSNSLTAGQLSTAVAVNYGAASRKVVLNGNIGSAGAGTTSYASLTFGLNRTFVGALARLTPIVFFDGWSLLQVVEARAWTDAEIVAFAVNPWQLFAPRPRRIWVPSVGSDISVALSGQASTAAAGTFGISSTVAASGQAATASAGTLPPSLAVAVSGTAATASAGTLVQSLSVALSGVAASASAGTVTPSVSLGLSGDAVVSYAGTITYNASGDVTLALSGQAIAASAGTLAPSTALALSGQAATVSAGTLTPVLSQALAGVAVAASAGTIVPSASVALAGTAASALAGTITYVGDGDVIVALSGQAVTAYAGTLTVERSFTSAGVLYLPIRMVSALWSAGAVTSGGEVAWLPPARQPLAYTDQRTGQMFCDPAWYRFFEYIAETRLAGKTGPTLTAVVQTLTETQTTAAAASATVTGIQQQTQANAESLYVTREVVKRAGLSGSEQIPFVEL